MAWLFDSGHAADIVLAVMAAEWFWLVRRGWRMAAATLMLAPGALMLLAVRAALTGAEWRWIAAALIASLPVHLLYVALRERSGGARRTARTQSVFR